MLEQIENTAKLARGIWLSSLGLCAYALLTLATMSDEQVVLNVSTFKLPIIGAEVSIQTFLWFTPLFLLALHLYFHLYIRRLWSSISNFELNGEAKIPTIEQIYPWSISDVLLLVNNNEKPISKYERISVFVSLGLGWGLVPLTLLFFLYRTLRFRMAEYSVLQIGVALAAIFVSVASLQVAHSLLSKNNTLSSFESNNFKRKILLPLLFSGAVFSVIPTSYVFFAEEHSSQYIAVNLKEADISSKPEGWFPLDRRNELYHLTFGRYLSEWNAENGMRQRPQTNEEKAAEAKIHDRIHQRINAEWAKLLTLVDSPILRAQNLPGANLTGAFAVRSNFSNSNFDAATIVGTSFQYANLSGASFVGARVRQAQFYKADLIVSDFSSSAIEASNYSRSKIIGSDFSNGTLMSTNFEHSDLAGVNFSGAKFVRPSTPEQYAVMGSEITTFKGAKFTNLNVLVDGVRRQIPVIFAGSDLRYTDISNEQISRSCGDKDTKLPADVQEIANCADVIGKWPLGEYVFTNYTSFLSPK